MAETLWKLGNELYANGKCEEAYKHFLQYADTDVKCAYGVARAYKWGYGVDKDEQKANQMFEDLYPQLLQLANDGDAEAQNIMGNYYSNGYFVDKDKKQAFEWYTKSAEQGYASAQYNLGCCYELGQGVAQDYAKAVEWYTKSAEQGDARAQYNLGYCYEFGHGVAQDYTKAVEWYTKSAEQGGCKSTMESRCLL